RPAEPTSAPPHSQHPVARPILVCSGLIAGRGGIIAAPSALLFSLFIGSILATQLHQAFRPQSPPIEEFNALISLRFPEVLAPLAIAVVIGAVAGWFGERLLPSQA